MFRSGLLVLCADECRLRCLLPAACRLVRDTLYVHVAPPGALACAHVARSVPAALRLLAETTYLHSARRCGGVDVRFLLPFARPQPTGDRRALAAGCDVVITAEDGEKSRRYVVDNFRTDANVAVRSLTAEDGGVTGPADGRPDRRTFGHVVVGGTFDRLHAGHKLLLSEACLRADRSLTVGVTDGEMNSRKKLCELMLPLSTRIADVQHFLKDIKPDLEQNVVPITDPFGPTIVEPNLHCLVVSEETKTGGETINAKRLERGMEAIEIVMINMLEDVEHSPEEEVKISSSSTRKRLLGTLLREPKPPVGDLSNYDPYIIGLTGGMASGKSSVCKRLAALGATVIDCDKLGHRAYSKGSPTFHLLVETFGAEIIGSSGQIDRKVLGEKVFSDPVQLEKLNAIVWPAIATLASSEIQRVRERGQGGAVVVIDAAVLLEAGWQNLVHEVWTTVIPVAEAVKRIVERNHLSEEEAARRLRSQLTNQQRADAANVVLSTLWEPEVTQRQVETAWNLLQDRITCATHRRL